MNKEGLRVETELWWELGTTSRYKLDKWWEILHGDAGRLAPHEASTDEFFVALKELLDE